MASERLELIIYSLRFSWLANSRTFLWPGHGNKSASTVSTSPSHFHKLAFHEMKINRAPGEISLVTALLPWKDVGGVSSQRELKINIQIGRVWIFESKFARSGQVGQTSCSPISSLLGQQWLNCSSAAAAAWHTKITRQANELFIILISGWSSIRPATREKADRWENKYIYESEQTAQTLTNTSSALSSRSRVCKSFRKPQLAPRLIPRAHLCLFCFVAACFDLLFLRYRDHPKMIHLIFQLGCVPSIFSFVPMKSIWCA
jgi:hypothetical protein